MTAREQLGVLAAALRRRGNSQQPAAGAGEQFGADAPCTFDTDEHQGARMRERGRILAIMCHPAAASNELLAHHLALFTIMPRGDAIAALRAAPPVVERTTRRLAGRMASAAPARLGPDAPGGSGDGSAGSLAAQIIAARDTAQPPRKKG